jgi:5-methylcytosine-specific restriction endonuclease McrA
MRPCIECGAPTEGTRCALHADLGHRSRGWAWDKRSKALRARVRACQRCGSRRLLQLHHLHPLGQGGHQDGPCVVLCSVCHHEAHRRAG